MLTLDKYQIIEEVGKGGMGVVYKAQDTKLGRIVALKELVIPPGYSDADNQNIILRFKREAQTAAILCHPNIVTVFDFGEYENRHFIAMEFLKGKNLKDYVNEGEKFEWNQLIDIFIQVAEGLSHAHNMNIIHRDIKPGNLQILPKNLIKITDFGLARAQDATSALTTDGAIFGTLGYISPEQIANAKNVDHRADIFSFGASMYEIITGKLPFEGDNIAATIYRIMSLEPYPIREFNENVPEKLEKIILKTLEKDPDDRYQKAEEIIKDLKESIDSFKANTIVISNSKVNESNTKALNVKVTTNLNDSDYRATKPIVTNNTQLIYSEEITKGQKIVVEQFLGTESIIVGANWNSPDIYPELSVMLLNDENKIEKEENFVFYNNLASPCSSVIVDTSENDLYNSLIQVNLAKVPQEICRIKFILSLEQKGKHLSDVKDIFINIIGKSRCLEYKPDFYSDELTASIIEIYKHKNQWKIHAVGEGFRKDLEMLLHEYVDDKIQIQ